ncbi:restriction endonuclease subunit S [Candidatus Nitrotoga sp. 1052]|uniref:restriction endonuclease subunit S n=1 Tax=Candidatus Nitrotoga sp. 1052 TaxID=2886964 RepID=UPI001EF6177C|nr:restriction endonuclease subunit S [Candidatus Nitrotoga sp. 1052]CAH1074571.1 Type I restriction-modification system, specificity subunit S [Candidatus Nitrotoga sp. 1052]
MNRKDEIALGKTKTQFIDGDRSSRYPKREEYVESGIMFLNGESIHGGFIDRNAVNFIAEKKYSEIKKGRIARNDIVLTTRGNSVGDAAFVNIDDKGLINAQMLILRVDSKEIHPKFFFYYITSQSLHSYILNFASGSAQPQIPIRDLRKIPICLPKHHIQRKVAAILTAYDELIENNQRRIALLEKMAGEIYREWFVRFRFPGYLDTRKVKGIPEGWKVERLGNIACSVKEKYVDLEHQEWPLVDLEKMSQRSLAVTNTGNPAELTTSRILFARNDILFSTIRPYLYKVNMAPFQGVTNTSVMVLRPRIPEYRAFVTMTLFMGSTIAWADQYSAGTKMPVISWNVFQKMELFDPGFYLAAQFDDLVSPILDQINSLSILNRRLAQSRDMLLPRLISGKLSVENLDIQFPPGMEKDAHA